MQGDTGRPSRIRFILGLSLASLLVAGAAGLSLAPVGAIERVEGEVVLSHGTEKGPARDGQALFEGDRLATGPDALAVITLGDHRVRLGPETSLLISEADSSGQLYRLFLWLGRIWLYVCQGLEAVDFRVETPAALAGVRGTLFTVTVATDGTTWVGVSEGQVMVQSPSGGAGTCLDEGYGTTTKPGGQPQRPTKLEPGEVGGEDLKKDGKEKDHDDQANKPHAAPPPPPRVVR